MQTQMYHILKQCFCTSTTIIILWLKIWRDSLAHHTCVRYCYQGFTAQRDHRCRYTCDVCNASECHLYPKKTKHCGDCLRYCRSDYCFQMHKKPPPGQKFAQCDVTKYCGKCNRRYHVSGTNPKPHKCPADCCVHCSEGLVTDGVHQCFIQPVKVKEPNNRYIFFWFRNSLWK